MAPPNRAGALGAASPFTTGATLRTVTLVPAVVDAAESLTVTATAYGSAGVAVGSSSA